MTACVIMHNMIIQDECSQNAVYGTYELMRRPVHLRRGGGRVARFLETYHDIRDYDVQIHRENRGVLRGNRALF